MTCSYCRLEGHRRRSCPVIRLEGSTAALADARAALELVLVDLRLTVLELGLAELAGEPWAWAPAA